MVFQARAQHQTYGRLGRVKKLESGAGEKSVVNDRRPHQHAKLGSRIDSTPPDAAAKWIEVFRMLPHQHRLGFAITFLLMEICASGRAPVMPHKRGRAETNFESSLLQSPAEVHVIACLPENWIKAIYLQQGRFVKSHVA